MHLFRLPSRRLRRLLCACSSLKAGGIVGFLNRTWTAKRDVKSYKLMPIR